MKSGRFPWSRCAKHWNIISRERNLCRKFLHEAPKFGNDDDYADEQVAWVSHVFAEEVGKQPNTRGGYAVPMGAPMQYYLVGGRVVGALPSGRKAWAPLSDAWSPCAGCDLNGPTAILGSMGKIDHTELSAGVSLNVRLVPAIFRMRDGLNRFVQFIRAFADQGLYQIQFNIVKTETLRQAQKEPDKYKDLVVKVAGYSAYFTRLMKPLQAASSPGRSINCESPVQAADRAGYESNRPLERWHMDEARLFQDNMSYIEQISFA